MDRSRLRKLAVFNAFVTACENYTTQHLPQLLRDWRISYSLMPIPQDEDFTITVMLAARNPAEWQDPWLYANSTLLWQDWDECVSKQMELDLVAAHATNTFMSLLNCMAQLNPAATKRINDYFVPA